MKHWYYSWLVPYMEGTLDAHRRAKLEARLARDPALAAEAEAVRRTAQRLRAAAQSDRSVAESVSQASDLWPGIEAQLRPMHRSASRPWLWAGGLCAAAALGWATLWGPLTPHTAYSYKPLNPVTTIAEKTTPTDHRPAGTEHGGHPRKAAHGPGKISVKRPNRGKKSAPLPRPAPADLLADRPAMTPSAVVPETADSSQGGSGHFRLATNVHDPSKGIAHPAGSEEMGPVAPPNDEGATTGQTVPGGPARSDGSPHNSRRKTHQRRHHRRRSAGQTAPTKAAPELPPDTIPPVAPASQMPKHRPDID